MSGTERTYSPLDPVERRDRWIAELLSLGLAVAGMVVRGGPAGVAAGVVLLVVWARLRTEFTFAAGAVLFGSLGGEIDAIASVVTLVGLIGLLAVDAAYAWGSLGPVILLLSLSAFGVIVIAYSARSVSLLWIAIGAGISLSAVSYSLHRYDYVRFDIIEETEGRGPSWNQTRGSASSVQGMPNGSPETTSDRKRREEMNGHDGRSAR